MNGGFKFEINVELKDIPALDDSHKRDCADAVAHAINGVFKYTMIFCAASVAFFGLYSLFSVNYVMRTMKLLPQMTIIIPIAAAACCVFEFIAGAMQRWAIVLEIILMAVILAASLMLVPTMWMIPFAAYGIIEHIKLFTIYPFYKVISEQKGYPEFTPLPTKDEIVVKKPEDGRTEEKAENSGSSADKAVPAETEKNETSVSEETVKPEGSEKNAEKKEDERLASGPLKTEEQPETPTSKAAKESAGQKKKKSKSRKKK